jgi:hypothetical protein
MTLAETSLWINSLLARAYSPRPDESTLEWAGKHVYVPPSVSPQWPGFYSIDPSPCVDILFDFYDSADWDEFFCPKSSQFGLSQAAHVCVLDYATFEGKNIAIALDSQPEAKRVSQTRLQPMIQACDSLAGKISENADDMSNLTLMLKGLTIFLMGSHSPSSLANKTIGLAVADEVDNYPETPKGESNAIDLLRDRLKKIIGAKLIAFSKPKDVDTIIWPEYLTGSRHKCFLPCPHCAEKQELVWEQVKFGECKNILAEWDYQRVLAETYYECIACKGKIEEHHKPAMVARREWRGTNLGQDQDKPKPRKMSAHISDLYSTSPKDTWGILAVEWIDAQRSTSKMMTFRRGRLALPWEEGKVEVVTSDIRQMVGGHERGSCPEMPDIILMAADVQTSPRAQKWVKTGWRLRDETCWVIDYGDFPTFEELIIEADRPVKILNWGDTPPEARIEPVVFKGLIDEGDGNMRTAVRDWVIDTFMGITATGQADYRFYPCWGRGGAQTTNWKDMFTATNVMHKGFPLCTYYLNEWLFKAELYTNRIGRFREITDAIKKNLPPPPVPRIWFPSGMEDEFVSELCQEARIWDEKKKRWIWRDPPKANDYGDALKMNLSLWYILLPILQTQAMQRIEAAMAAAKVKSLKG